MTDHQVEDTAEPDAEGDVAATDAGDAPPEGGGDAPPGDDDAPAGAGDAPAGGDAEAESDDDAEAESDDDTPPEGGGEAPPAEKDRLQALQEDIDEVRRRVADPLDDGDRTFIEEGEADKDQPVDDTIAPPG